MFEVFVSKYLVLYFLSNNFEGTIDGISEKKINSIELKLIFEIVSIKLRSKFLLLKLRVR